MERVVRNKDELPPDRQIGPMSSMSEISGDGNVLCVWETIKENTDMESIDPRSPNSLQEKIL